MEERLDDAINVLRNHAESLGGGAASSAPAAGPVPGPSPVVPLSHSNGIMAAYTPVLEPHMVRNLFFFLLFLLLLLLLPWNPC